MPRRALGPHCVLLAGLLAACTSNQPRPAVASSGASELPVGLGGRGHFAELTAVDGQRALLLAQGEGAATLTLTDGEAATWTYALPTPGAKQGIAAAPQVSGGVVTLPWIADDRFLGELGIDLATGAELWRASVPDDEATRLGLTDLRHIASLGDAAQRIEVVGDNERLVLLAFDPTAGTYQWGVKFAVGDWSRRGNLLTDKYVIFASGRADPDDPDNGDEVWHFVRRSDGERAFRIDGGEAACACVAMYASLQEGVKHGWAPITCDECRPRGAPAAARSRPRVQPH